MAIVLRLNPVTSPTIEDCRVQVHIRDDESDAFVMLPALTFEFLREKGSVDWVGGTASVRARFPAPEIDEEYIRKGREAAVAALRRELVKLGDLDVEPEEVRCPECRRILVSPEMPRNRRPKSFDCGSVHMIHYDDNYSLMVGG